MFDRTGAESNRQRVTVRTIAEAAGVHYTTVSRVLAQPSSPKESPTARLVRSIAIEHGYSRNVWAASLRSGRTQMIGVVAPHLTDVLMAEIYEAIQRRAAELGYLAVGSASHDEEDKQGRQIRDLVARRVDGLLIGDAHLDGGQMLDVLDQDFPFVLFVRRFSDWPHIGWDDEHGGYLVGRHFVAEGHKRFGVIAGPPHASPSVDRVQGFRRAIEEAGFSPSSVLHVGSSFDVAGGRAGAEQILEAKYLPTAVFAMNDYSAIGAMGAFRSRGLEVGRDIAVSGYNNASIAAELTIPLTSVSVPTEELGAGSLDMLIARLGGASVRSRLFTPSLIARESSSSNVASKFAHVRTSEVPSPDLLSRSNRESDAASPRT